jgi:UDP-glucose 4-epimerase
MLLLVGANGFLGRHMCELVERRGERAVAVVRRPDRWFFDHFAPSLEVVDASQFDAAAGLELISRARAVVYFVWRSVPATFAAEPWREVHENVEPAFEFFMRVARASRDLRIVFLSSGGTVYGNDGTGAKAETSATRPISPYGLGKLLAEEALRFVGRTMGNPFAVLRVSNAVGRWQADERQGIVGAALRAARADVPVELYGRGVQVRDFVDADEVAEAIYAACLDTKHLSATWNVGSGAGVAVADLVHRISRLISRDIRVEHAPARDIDVPHIVLDCRKIAQDLGWSAKTPLENSVLGLWQNICCTNGRPADDGP